MSSTPTLDRKILELNWNDTEKRFELKLDDGSMVYIPEATAEKMLLDLPKPSEEIRARYFLAKINQIRNERLLTIENVDKSIEDCIKRVRAAQDGAKNAKDKQDVMNWTAVIKGISAEKELYVQRRHFSRLLFTEEGYYLTLLAKLQQQKTG